MKLSRFYVLSLSFMLLLSFICNGQEKIRKIEKGVTRNEPIELVSAQVGEKPFDNENQILADKDWLRNIRLDVKNISDKTIVYMKVDLQIAAQAKMQYPLLLPLLFGQIPPFNPALISTEAKDAKPRELKPNQSIKISVPAYIIEITTKFMSENGIDDVEQVKYFFDFVVFDDGTAWSRGYQMRRDPNNPNRWHVLPRVPN